MKTSSLWLTVALLISLLPSAVFAHDFNQTDGLFFNANSALFRQRQPDRPWQLVSLPAGTIRQSVAYDGQLYLVVAGASGQTLVIQDQSLRFSLSSAIPASSSLVMKLVGDWLIVLSQTGSNSALYINHGDGFQLAAPPLITAPAELDQTFEFGGQLLLVKPAGSTTSIFRYQASNANWLLTSTLPCSQAGLITTPQIFISCQDGHVLYPIAPETWSTLSFPPVRNIQHSANLLVGWDQLDDHLLHIWSGGQVTSVGLPGLSMGQVEQLTVSGSRIIVRSAGIWFELLWSNNPPILQQLSSQTGLSLIDPSGDGQLFLSGQPSFLSATAGNWSAITTQGSFSHARSTPLGWLIWNDGSLTQFAPTNSTNFIKVNPWSSTTSPLQAIFIGDQVSYASVITQSGAGNVNLYKTTDFIHWSRLTLPTKPTLAPTITEARSLPSGTDIELSGILAVGPGIVSADTTYLEDEFSGIQLFLSQTAGNLPSALNRYALATGEISTSQVKRLTLSSPADLEVGGSAQLILPTITADQASSNLGRSVLLQGTVADTDTDWLSFRQLASLFKVHFAGAKASFQIDDQVLMPAVIDWNSGSGQIESWATSASFQLIFRSPGSTTAPVEATQPARTSSISSKSAPSQSTTILASAPSPIVKTALTRSLADPSGQVLVGADNSTNPVSSREMVMLGLAGLIAGLTSMHGRRFRRLFDRL